MKRKRGMHMLRRDIFVLAVVFMIASAILMLTPLESTSVAPYTLFEPSNSDQYSFMGPLYLPAGDSIHATIVTGSALTIGIVTYKDWTEYQSGNVSKPSFVILYPQDNTGFSYTAAGNSLFVIVVSSPIQSLPPFKLVLHALRPYYFEPYAVATLIPGLSLLLLSFFYRSIWARYQERVRDRRLRVR